MHGICYGHAVLHKHGVDDNSVAGLKVLRGYKCTAALRNTRLLAVLKFSHEIIGLRDHYKDIAGVEFRFNSPIAPLFISIRRIVWRWRLATASDLLEGNWVFGPLVPSHCSLVFILYLGHFSVVLDLRKFPLFPAGVYESMT